MYSLIEWMLEAAMDTEYTLFRKVDHAVCVNGYTFIIKFTIQYLHFLYQALAKHIGIQI